MKTILIITMALAGAVLAATPLRAEELVKGMMCGSCMKENDAKPEVDYYTCTMHPAVHWPIPGKCPICSMDLVPVFKKPSDA